MYHSTLVVAYGIVNERPDYSDAKVEQDFYSKFGKDAPSIPVPTLSLARLRFALSAFRSAFVAYDVAR